MCAGIGWLVRDGLPFIRQSIIDAESSVFVNEKAPRTAVGVLRNGSALILQVDGQEVRGHTTRQPSAVFSILYICSWQGAVFMGPRKASRVYI
jgi:exopolysaccharide biosynthesis protein